MEYLLGILLLAVLTAALTAWFLVLIFMYYKNKFSEELIERLQQVAEDDDIVDAYIDFDKELMIMYTRDDNTFVAQGKDWEELNKNAIDRFPNLMFNVSTEDAAKAKGFNK